MRSVRKGVFETNSSSTHSLTIRNGETFYPESVNFEFGEFGWEIENYDDVETKLSYLLTFIGYVSEEVMDTKTFEVQKTKGKKYEEIDWKAHDKAIFDAYKSSKYFSWLRELLDDLGIEYNKIKQHSDGWAKIGLIDHQSAYFNEVFPALWFSNRENFRNNIEEYLFNDGYILHTDNDNH